MTEVQRIKRNAKRVIQRAYDNHRYAMERWDWLAYRIAQSGNFGMDTQAHEGRRAQARVWRAEAALSRVGLCFYRDPDGSVVIVPVSQ